MRPNIELFGGVNDAISMGGCPNVHLLPQHVKRCKQDFRQCSREQQTEEMLPIAGREISLCPFHESFCAASLMQVTSPLGGSVGNEAWAGRLLPKLKRNRARLQVRLLEQLLWVKCCSPQGCSMLHRYLLPLLYYQIIFHI